MLNKRRLHQSAEPGLINTSLTHKNLLVLKKEIEKHQQFKAVGFVMDKNAEAFAEKPDILAAKVAFVANTSLIGSKLSQLIRPVSTVIFPKIDSESRMRLSLSRMIAFGISLATSQDLKPMLLTLKRYNLRWRRCSAYQLYEIALHVHELLNAIAGVAADNGLTAEKLAEFKTSVDSFGETLDLNGTNLSDRRKTWQDLKKLISANNHLLRHQLDPFIHFLGEESPVLNSEYMFIRKRKRKNAGKANAAQLCDISGTVTDSLTGEYLSNAIINLISPESIVETDEDGYYLLDELAAGEYTITCHLTGYEVPSDAKVTAAAGESLVVNFVLVPIQVPATETSI